MLFPLRFYSLYLKNKNAFPESHMSLTYPVKLNTQHTGKGAK